MNYHPRSKPKTVQYPKLPIVFVLLVVLCGFGYAFPNFSREVFTAIGRPLWFVSDSATSLATSVKEYFVFKQSLISENVLLQQEIAELRLKDLDYNEILKENQDLQNVGADKMPANRVVGKILSKPPMSPYDTFVVGVGSEDGVVAGDFGYISDTIVAGTVTSASPHTSIVTLFSSGSGTQDATDSRTGATFSLVGKGGGNFQLEAPKDADITWGDTFLYPTHTTSVLATVYYVDTNSQSSFKTVYLRTSGNIFSSQWVFIEK